MKKIFLKIVIIVGLLLIAFLVYKLVMLNKYKSDYVAINTNSIFNEILDVTIQQETGNYKTLSFNGLSIQDFFDGYEKSKGNASLNVKYNENGQVISFYSISSINQYIKMMSLDALTLSNDHDNDKLSDNKTEKNMKLFFEKAKIENDVDYLNYIKNNYYIQNNIFTDVNTMRNNYLLNTFVQVALPEFENIILIDGKITGYIINMKNSNIKEIHILNNDIQYIIVLGGDELTSNEFVKKLLSTVRFSK